MKPVRLEILIDDKTLQGLNSAKGNLNMLEGVYKQILSQLNKELKVLQQNLKSSLEQGIDTDKQAAEVQALTGVVNDLTESLEELKEAKKQSNSTPIVGANTTQNLKDSKKLTDNLRLQISQVARELPALAMGPQMFILAVSNNLPYLADAIKDVRVQNEQLAKSNTKTISVWKTVLSSIFSWQTALIAVISLLTVYGDDILKFAGNLLGLKKNTDALTESQERYSKALSEAAREAMSDVTRLTLLYNASTNVAKSTEERQKATKALKDEYPDYFGKLSNETIMLGQASDAYKNLAKNMVAASKARAAMGIMDENSRKILELEQQREEKQAELDKANAKSVEATDKMYRNRNVWTALQADLARNKTIGLDKDITKLNDDIKLLEDANKKIEEGINISDLLFESSGNKGGNATSSAINYAEELAEARINAQIKLENMLIETMADGFKKRQALAAQQLKEEIARINADEKAQLDTIKKARAAGQSVDTNAEQQVQDNAQQQRKAANNKYLQDSAKIEKQWQEQSLQSWIAYYEKYGTYAQQRVAIIQKYALKMNNTQDENEKALFTKQQEEELQSLDEKFGKSVKQMTDLFEDASKKSVSAIEEIIAKYEKLVDYMTNSNSNITKEDLLAVGFTEKDLKDLETGTIKISDVTNALKGLKGELKGKSPFKAFATDLKAGFAAIKESKGDLKGTAQGIGMIGAAIDQFTPALKQFSEDLGTIFGYDDSKVQGIIEAVGGLGKTAAGIAQAISGDVIGGIMTAVNGIATMVRSLDGLFGADYSGYERLRDQYELLNGVWDDLIDKKKEYISISYGEEATKAGEEAKKLSNDQISRYRQLLDELASSGASIGSHSLAYRINDRMAKEDWAVISKLVGETIRESNDLWDLTADQLEQLLQDPKIVSVLGEVNEDFLTYIQDIIDAQDELEEVEKSIKEQLTQTSFENMQDSFWNALLDMEKDAEAFGDDLTKTMQKAIVKANLGKTYESQLQTWYEKFAKANQADGINTEEYESLREEYNSIVEAALKERNELMKIFGWETEAEKPAQSGRAGAVTTITEETAGKLEGIANAQLDRVIGMDIKMESMSDNLSAMASSIATVAENSEYLKRLDDIADNIQNMNSTGVKIKN